MSNINQEDRDYSITRNFEFKQNYSSNSLEAIAYNKTVAGESTVENREKRKQWLESLYYDTTNTINSIVEMRSTGKNHDGYDVSRDAQESIIEQKKMRILDSMSWHYNGSFYHNLDATYVDGNGNKKYVSSLYPELSFHIETRKMGDKYMYAASYGIMRGSSSSHYGTYSYFVTLDEALEFIKDELMVVGRKQFYNRLRSEIFNDELSQYGIRKPDKSVQHKINHKASKVATEKINKLITKELIQSRLHAVKRSTDIFVLPDLIERFLMDIAEKNLAIAGENEFRANKARNIVDTDIVELDGVDNDSHMPQQESIEDVVRQAEESGYRKALDSAPRDFEPQGGQSQALFAPDAPHNTPDKHVTDQHNLDDKPPFSPSDVQHNNRNHEDESYNDDKNNGVEQLMLPVSIPSHAPQHDNEDDNNHQGDEKLSSDNSINTGSDSRNDTHSNTDQIKSHDVNISHHGVEDSLDIVPLHQKDIMVSGNDVDDTLDIDELGQKDITVTGHDIDDTLDINIGTSDIHISDNNNHTDMMNAQNVNVQEIISAVHRNAVDTLIGEISELSDMRRYPVKNNDDTLSLVEEMNSLS